MKWLLWFFVVSIGALPLRLRSSIGAALGWLGSLLPTSDREIALLQIKIFLGSQYPFKILRQTYSHFGSMFFESLNLAPMLKRPDDFIDFPDWDLVERLLSENRGIVALTAHTGNWDAMGAYFAKKQVPLLAIAKQMRNPAVQFAMQKLRSSYGFQTLWRANKKGISEIIAALRRGQVVAAVIDQDTRVSSMLVPFFGLPARTPSTIVEIGKKTNAIFVSAFVFKKESGRYEIKVELIDSALSTIEILKEYNCRLEQGIRRNPGQWAWFHKRWRSSLTGERLGGKAYLNYLNDEHEKHHVNLTQTQ